MFCLLQRVFHISYIHIFFHIKHKKYIQKTHTVTNTHYVKHKKNVQSQKKVAWKPHFLGKTRINCKQIDAAYFLKMILPSLSIMDNRSVSQILEYSVKLASNFTIVFERRKKLVRQLGEQGPRAYKTTDTHSAVPDA